MPETAPTSPTDPLDPQPVEAGDASVPLVVDIARIQPYERNPRHGRNPE